MPCNIAQFNCISISCFQQTLSLSDWSNFLACGDAAGEVVAVFLKSCSKNWPKFVSRSRSVDHFCGSA